MHEFSPKKGTNSSPGAFSKKNRVSADGGADGLYRLMVYYPTEQSLCRRRSRRLYRLMVFFIVGQGAAEQPAGYKIGYIIVIFVTRTVILY